MEKSLSKEGLLYILSKIDDETLKNNETSIVIGINLAAKAVNNWVVTDLSQDAFDALVSFAFDVGIDTFKRSSLLKLLNKGLIEEASQEFANWVYVKGEKIEDLVTRRYEEKAKFVQGELQPSTP